MSEVGIFNEEARVGDASMGIHEVLAKTNPFLDNEKPTLAVKYQIARIVQSICHLDVGPSWSGHVWVEGTGGVGAGRNEGLTRRCCRWSRDQLTDSSQRYDYSPQYLHGGALISRVPSRPRRCSRNLIVRNDWEVG
ncbi:hypothetical protein ANO14919_137830 [Xylariales sp. No.14919]|nr:hypothetical protein ANO14919_137830 [Xylariales sp. No.14919]